MAQWVDDATGYTLTTPDPITSIADRSLIEWCREFLTPDSVYVDIDAGYGAAALLLHSYCHQVIAFETNQMILLQKNCQQNKVNNVDIQPLSSLPDLQVRHIALITMQHNHVANMVDLIQSNHYPPIIFKKNDDIASALQSMQYRIHAINGYPHLQLASDHTEFKKPAVSYYHALTQFYTNADASVAQKVASEAHEHDNMEVGLDACEYLIDNTTNEPRQFAMTKIMDYITPLPIKHKVWLNCPMRWDRVPNNPSIIATRDGYLCNLRCSNYVYDPHFRFLDGGQVHLSDHVLLTLDYDFHVTDMKVMVDKTDNVYYDSFVKGCDDVRLITSNLFICSHGNLNSHRTIQQCLGTLNDEGEITKLIPLRGPNLYRHEKNWLPILNDEGLFIIYTTHPFVLYKVDQNNGNLILIKNQNLTSKNGEGFRGSSPPIKYNCGYLYTIHQVTKNLSYFHRFVWIDENFTTLKWSTPFYFDTKGIEFNVGMCHGPDGLVMAHSVWDNHARLIVVDYDVINQLLN